MIRLVLNTATATSIRFGISPAMEAVQLTRTIARRVRPLESPEPWVRGAAEKISALGVDELVDTMSSASYYPDFLHPAPGLGSDRQVLERQLSQVRNTPLAHFEFELAMAYGGQSHRWASSSLEEDRNLITDQLTRCINVVMKPMWQRVKAIASTDIGARGRRTSTMGLAQVMNGLHSRIRMTDDAVEYESVVDKEMPVGDAGLILIPSVLGPREVGVGVQPPGPMQITYPAKGSALLYEPGGDNRALADVLGSTRVSLLAETAEPTTTTDLAMRLGLSPATVSYHLTALSGVGWLTRTRIGRRVEYELSELGRRILIG